MALDGKQQASDHEAADPEEEELLRELREADAWAGEWYDHGMQVLDDFVAYCVEHWGLSERTARGYRQYLNIFADFLVWQYTNGQQDSGLLPKDLQRGDIDWSQAPIVALETADWSHVSEFAGYWWPAKAACPKPSDCRKMMVAFRRLYSFLLETGRYRRERAAAEDIIRRANPREADELAKEYREKWGLQDGPPPQADVEFLAAGARRLLDQRFFAWLEEALEYLQQRGRLDELMDRLERYRDSSKLRDDRGCQGSADD